MHTTLLSGETCPNDCRDVRVVNPWFDYQWPDRMYDDDCIRVVARNGQDKVVAYGVEIRVGNSTLSVIITR
jgi:hypothetical protein